MNKKFFLAAGLIVVVSLSLGINAYGQKASVTNAEEGKAKIAELKASLRQNPTHLQYAEYMMLKHKYPEKSATTSPNSYYYNDDYYLKPQGRSPLSQEFSGGGNGPDGDLLSGIDVITGERAIDESLQLGSIGSGASANNFGQRQLTSALELYYNDNSAYPETLNQLVPKYISVLPTSFSYKKVGSYYELKADQGQQPQIDVSQVKPLEIKGHNWDSMIKTAPKVPDIFSLVPADDAVVYFRDMDKLSQLEQSIKDIGKPIQSIYSLNNSVEVKDKIFKRLGLRDIKEMRSLMDEAALVAYDLDAYPNTDYALVLKIKSSVFNNFISSYITAPKDRQAQVGEYYVIATDNSFLQSIVNAKQNSSSSMGAKKDLAYALSVLEPNYDGFAYFSEDFVKKLTGPAYRINARRRNTVLNTLETLQYAVFAYKNITGNWPGNLDQIAAEGYMQTGTIANMGDYYVDGQGIVKNKVWGSIYDVTPIDRVPISSISFNEGSLYESFKNGYQNYWREYIDPVGVAILVGDQIRFHTIILPLIDKSEYNWLKDIAGGDGVALDFLNKPDRLASLQGVMKITVDDAIYALYKASPGEFDEAYTKCRDDYYNSAYRLSGSAAQKTLDETCKQSEKTREQAIAFLKDKVAKAIGWKEKTPVFDFIGNEITIAGGDNLVFNIEDLSKLDVFIGIELKDQGLAKKFLDQVFAWYREKIGNAASESGGLGLFRVEQGKPIKNSYNNVDYYVIPVGGLTNIYYLFLNNRFYMTVSQSAINNIIDGKKQGKLDWPAHMQRLFDYMGEKMNLAFILDNTKLQSWLKGYIKDQWASYSGASSIRSTQSYYSEALELAKALPNYDGTVANVSGYYRFIPTQWFDANLYAKNGQVYLSSNNQEYNLNDIDLGSSGYLSYPYYGNEDVKRTPKTVKLADITKNFNVDKTLADWQKLKDLGVAFNLSNEGLDIKIAFSNTVSSAYDSRVGGKKAFAVKIDPKYLYAGGGVLVIIIFGVIFWVVKKRKTSVSSFSDADAQAPAVVVPPGDNNQSPPGDSQPPQN